MRIFAAIRNWWVGKYIPYKDYSTDSVIMFLGGYYERPALARAVEFAWDVWMKHWQMILGVAGFVVAAVALLT